jgi:chemosensory pili system protein ChpA (sensor histidine kinase/response regulator)
MPSVEVVLPVPVPDVESLELDLADLQGVFEEAGTPLPEATLNLAQLAEEAPPATPQQPVLREADLPLPLADPADAAEAAPGLAPAPDINLAAPMLAAGAMAAVAAFASEVPAAEVSPERVPEPELNALGQEAAESIAAESEDEQVKVIGPLRISIPLFNIYLNEADELSRRLGIELAEWALEHERHPVPESSVSLAHSLAGSSATVGYTDLSALARALEHALMRSHAAGHGRPGEAQLFNDAAEEIRRLLHQFAAASCARGCRIDGHLPNTNAGRR